MDQFEQEENLNLKQPNLILYITVDFRTDDFS